MTDLTLPPLPRSAPSATDQVFGALYEAIVTLTLPPGAKLSEIEVAKQLGVSRQPVRDAFFRLSNIGLIAIRPQRATLVTPISEMAVLDAVFMRVALELEALRKVVDRAGAAEFARLGAVLEQQEAALGEADPLVFHASDEAMHALFFEIAGHPQAWALILERKAHMDRVRRLTLDEARRKRVLAEHKSLIAALEAQDLPRVEAEIRAHIEDIKGVLAGLRASHGHYFETSG